MSALVNLRKSLRVLWHFFWLGCISFGGPAAHIGYFRQHFVERLQWLSENEYSQLIALSQFLPGPGSSQIGFAIGLKYAGIFGAWAAFIGFTLPSFLLLFWVALYQPPSDQPIYALLISGLKLLAVAVVADALSKMFRQFCRDALTSLTALMTALILLGFQDSLTAVILLLSAFAIGWHLAENRTPPGPPAESPPKSPPKSTYFSWHLLTLTALIVALSWWPQQRIANEWLALFAPFAQAGSLVFGGGHVVLPLLQNTLGEPISHDAFLSGYALAQAVPGPMFSFAAYLGALLMPQAPLSGAIVATLGLFLPGLLLVLALLHRWQSIALQPRWQGAIRLLNAAVVGLLLATLITPVASSAITSVASASAALIGFIALQRWQVHIGWLLLAFGVLWPSLLWIGMPF